MSESSRIPGRPHQEFKLRVLKHLAVRVVLPIAACSLVVGFGPVLARDDEDGRAIGLNAVGRAPQATPRPCNFKLRLADHQALQLYCSI